MFPNTLIDERVLLMNRAVAVGGKSVDDDLRIGLGGGKREPSILWAFDDWVMHRRAPTFEWTRVTKKIHIPMTEHINR